MHRISSTIIIIIVLLSFAGKAAAQDVQPQEKSLGIGLAIGDRTGFSYKYWLTEDYALSGIITGTAGQTSQLYLHWDLLIHRHDVVTPDEGYLPLYYGFGFYTILNDGFDNVAGLRAPVGIEYILADQRLGVFMEAAPVLRLTGSVLLNFRGQIGFRYYL